MGKKFIIGLYVFIFLMAFLSEFSFLFEDANLLPNDYARITDVDYKAQVVDEFGSQGKVVITERLTFDIHAASKSNPFRELWRDLCEDYVDGVKVEYKVNSVKQILEDGSEIVYQESPKLYYYDSDYSASNTRLGPYKWYHSKGPYNEEMDRYECVFFYVNDLYREKVVFEIEYEMYNAALRYGDCSELYLTCYSESSIKYLNSFKGQVLIPNDKMPRRGNYIASSYGTNNNSFPIHESSSLNPGFYTFYFNLYENDLKFKPYNQYIEFALISYGEDKHKFTNYASHNDYYYDNDVFEELMDEQNYYMNAPEKFNGYKKTVLLVCGVIAFMVLIGTPNIVRKLERKYDFFTPNMDIDTYREIPSNLDPNFAASLVFCKHKPKSDKSDEYAGIMLSLVRKKYIELKKVYENTDWIPSNIYINIKYVPKGIDSLKQNLETLKTYHLNGVSEMDDITYNTTISALEEEIRIESSYEPLSPSEQHYFNLITRHAKNNSILMSYFQSNILSDYNFTSSFVKNVDNSVTSIGTNLGYIQKADYTEPRKKLEAKANKYIVYAILFLVFVNLISYNTRLDFAFGGFTILGINYILCALYLKKVSKKYVLLTQFGQDEYAKWRGLYNFLNSDTLMRERTVIELPLWEKYLVYATAFGISDKVVKALEINCPDLSSSEMLSNSYYRSTRFRHYSRSFGSSTRTASFSSFGGGSGYGGGGRGGGGGGGGH